MRLERACCCCRYGCPCLFLLVLLISTPVLLLLLLKDWRSLLHKVPHPQQLLLDFLIAPVLAAAAWLQRRCQQTLHKQQQNHP